MSTILRAKRTATNWFIALTSSIMLFTTTATGQLSAPPQPEVTGFEPINTTDMVNLSTGDFTYSLPIVHVPGDGGGFSMPLSYHSGIETEQEASWVGLGWSLNPGVIMRDVNEFPDDFKGVDRFEHYAGELANGWGINLAAISVSYDSEKGYGGTINFLVTTIGFGSKLGMSAFGMTISRAGLETDPVGIIMSVADFATAGGSSMVAEATQTALGITGQIFKTLSFAQRIMSLGSNVTNIDDLVKSRVENYWFFYRYKVYIYSNINTHMYGSLYLGFEDLEAGEYRARNGTNSLSYLVNNFQNTENKSVANDMHMYVPSSDYVTKVDYADVMEPASIAYDRYNVMGTGVSGAIEPYRQEVGSLVRTTIEDYDYKKINLVPFLKNDPVYFRYKGEFANYYDYHESAITDPMGIEFDPIHLGDNIYNPCWDIKDPRLYTAGERRSPNRAGLKAGRLYSGNYIEWVKNSEMASGINSRLMNFLSGNEQSAFWGALPPDGIGGFAITRNDGMTYHYALPVFNLYQKTYSSRGDEFKSYLEINKPFAINWLLTAITGPDFVDRSANGDPDGIVDEYDWGYWVKFEYGKFGGCHKWNSPEEGFHEDPENEKHISFSEGAKEIYYLDEIKTRTHTAVFVKDKRPDDQLSPRKIDFVEINVAGFTFYELGDVEPLDELFKSLYLSDIYLLKNEDYKTLTGTYQASRSNNGNIPNHYYDNVWDINDFDSGDIGYLHDNQLNRVHFKYNYNLCKNAPGSESGQGKLALERVMVSANKGVKPAPDYVFGYGDYNDPLYNPDFDKDKHDGWGMYSYPTNLAIAPWTLRKIISPLGAEINISYEKDSYSNISGYPVMGGIGSPKPSVFNNSGLNEWVYVPMDLAVQLLINDYVRVEGTLLVPPLEGSPPGTPTQEAPFDLIANIEEMIIDDHAQQGRLRINKAIIPTGTNIDYSVKDNEVDVSRCSGVRSGGDVRVASVTAKDELGNEYKTRYIYSIDGLPGGLTSGTVCTEPVGARDIHRLALNNTVKNPFYLSKKPYILGYPESPVMYAKVNVLSGELTTDEDYYARTEYTFTVPDINMVKVNTIDQYATTLNIPYHFNPNIPEPAKEKEIHYQVDFNTSQIGGIKSVKQYNSEGEVVDQTIYDYTSNGEDTYGKLGKYTEGTILCEAVKDKDDHYVFKLLRTTKKYNPSIPKSVTTIRKGVSKTIENTVYDLFTGNVLESE